MKWIRMQSRDENTIKKTLEKIVANDTTSVINSTLHDNNVALEFSKEEEPIKAACNVIYGPIVEATTGIVMIVSGVALSVVPNTVLSVKTTEKENNAGKKIAEITAVDFKERQKQTPWYYEQITTYKSEQDSTITKGEAAIRINLKTFAGPEQAINNSNRHQFDKNEAEVETTVTGYNLATTGLSRVVDGLVVKPLSGIINLSIFGAKIVSEEYQNQLKIIENKKLLQLENTNTRK